MSPAAVMPATVAEPSDTRITPAISQPSTSASIDSAVSASEMFLSTPVATNTSFSVPAPAMISRITAMSLTELPYSSISACIFMPRDRPSVYVATARPSSMTISGLVQNFSAGWRFSGASGTAIDSAMITTGSNALAKQLNAPGSSASGRSGATNSVIGLDFTLRNRRAYSGPAQIMAGSATMMP